MAIKRIETEYRLNERRTFQTSTAWLDDHPVPGHDYRMTRRSRPLNLLLILALLLGTAMPLLHAASASEGFWTKSCTGKALFVPTARDDAPEHVRCLSCLAEPHDDHGFVAKGHPLRVPSQVVAHPPGCAVHPPESAVAGSHIRAPPARC